MVKALGITEVVLRDAHQSLLATRFRLDDMLPICSKLDQVGFWSIESWGGATFDSCIRYLGEDPWERIRALKKAMPNTPQQMLLRGQNILGYRHYADDVVDRFVERAAASGIDVFRIFDALNDTRNFERAINAALKVGRHAQAAISYTVSPVHTLEIWLDLAKRLEDMGANSIAIKDMAGLLKPYVAEELVARLKQAIHVPIHLHSHATTGLSTATLIKAVEAGVDNVDTAISSMSGTYSHSATETIVAALEHTGRDTGLNIELLEEISEYFIGIRKKYAAFEGSLQGCDSRILVAQVPGGMLTNMESQLKEQGALHRVNEVMAEIPRVRADLGFIPLVTPTSQIVGTQAVINVLSGERYKTVTKEAAGVIKGEYGATPAPVDAALQRRVLGVEPPITCRPADLLEPEMERLQHELREMASKENVRLAADEIDDVLTYALFPQIGWKFLQNRGNPAAFEPAPAPETQAEIAASAAPSVAAAADESVARAYSVTVNGKSYQVEVAAGGSIASVQAAQGQAPVQTAATGAASEVVKAPMAGYILRINVKPGQQVQAGQVVVVMEAMKMETEVRVRNAGVVKHVAVQVNDTVTTNDTLVTVG